MLTGDKIETAKCIAISAGLKDKKQEIFEIKEVSNAVDINLRLNEFEKKILAKKVADQRAMLIIDGNSLNVVLGS